MQLVTLDDELLAQYVNKKIVLVAGSRQHEDETRRVHVAESLVFKGQVLRLFTQEGRVLAHVGLEGMVQATFDQAMNNLMSWQRRVGRNTYYFSQNATVDDSGNLSFAPSLTGACAFVWGA